MDFQIYDCNNISNNMGSHIGGATPKLWTNNNNSAEISADANDDYFNWTNELKIEEKSPGGARKRKLPVKPESSANECSNGAKKISQEPNISSSEEASWQVENNLDLNQDLDGSLQSLGNGEHSNASFNMSEAILTLSSLAALKQEAPSPPNAEFRAHNQQQPSPHNRANNNNNGSSNSNVVNQDAQDNQDHAESGSSLLNATLHQLLSQTAYNPIPSAIDGNILNTNSQDTYANGTFAEDARFQYVLAAATSIATKINEDTLTYLNQGQSYEIKLKKLGELSMYRGKLLKSIIKICFHERRLQYMEKEQITSWQQSRPGDRILEIDVPLSYGLCDVIQPNKALNTVQFSWDPTKEVGAYIKVNCISTEFTPKKHGGEKGVPFRIQVETYQAGDGYDSPKRLHAAACQIKVFKLKGADRKHKQDREKILKRSACEQEKYQPSYDCTVLNDIQGDVLINSPTVSAPYSPENGSQTFPNSVDDKHLVSLSPASSHLSEKQTQEVDTQTYSVESTIVPSSNTQQTSSWLMSNRFEKFAPTFANFCGADMLRMTRDDLIQICGHADGIRLHNSLHSKQIAPKLTIYVCRDNSSAFNAIFLNALNNQELSQELATFLNVQPDHIKQMYMLGPQMIHVQINADVIKYIRDESMFNVEVLHKNGNLVLLLRNLNK